MIFDPAWDMPRVNWQQQGSFEIPEIPPAYEPDAEPLVCLPAINQYWLPFVMGALDQLRNPSSWLVADDDAMSTTLYRVTKLREMIGARAICMSFAIRFDAASCQLQQSTDGGTTWIEVDGWDDFVTCLPPQTLIEFDSGCTLSQSLDGGMSYEAVPGWIENFGSCVQNYMPIIGLPPNPGDETPDQFACSIASYLASTVILNAMSAAVTAIQDDLTLLSFGANVLDFIPEFVLVRLGYDAISIIYAAVSEGTLSDYEDAIADGTLWLNVSCAIYDAIESLGYVTPANFGAILANIAAISYAHSDVISTIESYISSLGATGLAQLSQRAGLETGADCSSCAGSGWCYTFDFTHDDGGFTSYSPPSSAWVPGQGWTGTYQSAESPPATDASIMLTFPTTGFVTGYSFGWYADQPSGGAQRELFARLGGTNLVTAFVDGGAHPGGANSSIGVSETIDNIILIIRSAGVDSNLRITDLTIVGTGANPFGASNC